TTRRRWRADGGLRGVAGRAAGPGLGRLDLAVLRRRVGDELVEQARRGGGDRLDGAEERLRVGLRGLRVAGDLAHVREGGVARLLLRGGGLEVVERADVAAHAFRVGEAAAGGQTSA